MEKKLRRTNDAWIAGVCGGLADYFDVNKDAVRIGWLLLTLCSAGFPGLVAYLVLWLIMPKED